MDFRALEVYVAVVEALSFSRAAERLGVSQPTVSQHVRQLEEELDAALLARSSREVSVTDAGLRLYRGAVDLLDARRRLLAGFLDPDERTLRVGVSTIPAGYLLPEALATYAVRRPAVRVQAEGGNSAGVIGMVAAGQVDLGLVGMRTEHDGVDFVPLTRDEIVLIAPNSPKYAALLRRPDVWEAVLAEPVVVRESGSGSGKHMALVLAELGVDADALRIAARINDVEVIKRLVARGIGVSFVSGLAARDMVERGELLSHALPETVDRYRDLYVATNRKLAVPTHVADFVDVLRRLYGGVEPA